MTIRMPRAAVRRYRGRSVTDLRRERRQRLLDAGVLLVGQKGYASLTIEKLCAKARVSPRHFYEHFPSREALLVALFDDTARATRQVVVDALGDTGTNAPDAEAQIERMLGAVAAFVRHALADPHRARIAFIETVGVSAEMEKHRRAAIRAFAAIIAGAADQLAARSALPPGRYQLAAVALVGATNELLVEWLSGDTPLSAEQMERAIINLFRTLIMGARSALSAT